MKNLIWVVITGVLFRLVFIFAISNDSIHNHDGWRYLNVARNIRNGHGIAIDPKDPKLFYHFLLTERLGNPTQPYPTAFVPPVYPIFLTAFTNTSEARLIAVKLFQIVFDIVTIICAYFIGFRLYDHATGIIAAIVVAAYTFSIFFCGDIGTESMFTACFLSSIAIMIYYFRDRRPKWTVIAGFTLGVTSLIRHTPILLIPIMALLIIGWRPRFRSLYHAALFLCSGLFPVVVWLIRNKLVFGTFILSSQGNMVLWLGNNYYYDYHIDDNRRHWHYSEFTPEIRDQIRDASEVEMADVFQRHFLNFVKSEPGHFVLACARKAADYWRPFTYSTWYDFRYLVIALGTILTLYVLSGIGIFMTVKRRLPMPLILLAPVIYGWLIHIIYHPLMRFRVTFADIFLIIYAAFAVNYLFKRLKSYQEQSVNDG